MALAVDSTATMGPGSRGGSRGSSGGGSGSGGRAPSVRPGLLARLAALRAEGESILAELDPDRLSGGDASALYAEFAGVERTALAGKTLLAPRVEASGVWRQDGHKDAASHLAAVEGVSAGQARGTLVNGRRLVQLPGTEQAVREGTLSGPKLTELCGAAILDPDRESELLSGAATQPLREVQERCRRSKAASAHRDPLATVRRIHAERSFRFWSDADGAFCFSGRDTADRGARILNHLRHAADSLEKQRRAARKQEHGANSATTTPSRATASSSADGPAGAPAEETVSQRALWADAFYALVTQQTSPAYPVAGAGPGAQGSPGPLDEGAQVSPARTTGPGRPVPSALGRRAPGRSGSPPGPGSPPSPGSPPGTDPSDPRPPPSEDALSIITRPPDATCVVLVDLDAWRRGTTLPGERCEINGQGPIPVTMARDLASDSLLGVLFHQAGDVRAISHLGRTINAKLRTALVYRDRTCVVPGCGVSSGLEIDHVHDVHLGGPTELDNLALLCYHHHQLKTYEGWVLTRLGVDEDGRTRWRFEPQPPFGQEPDLGIDTEEGRAEWAQQRLVE